MTWLAKIGIFIPQHLSKAQWWALLFGVSLFLATEFAWAHDVSENNRSFVEALNGAAPAPYFYLGAKHMVTGLDHILFLLGVVFFLDSFRSIALYVSLFTLGHSVTLIAGVLNSVHINPYLIDAIIGGSVVYKALENLGGFNNTLSRTIDLRLVVFLFGLAHGLGLATKLLDLSVSKEGLIINLLSFNLGVEVGQILVLLFIVGLLNFWRGSPSFKPGSRWINTALLAGGFMLIGQHLTGWIVSGGNHA